VKFIFRDAAKITQYCYITKFILIKQPDAPELDIDGTILYN